MRDPARIDRLLELIRARWKASPDLRLGQLLYGARTASKGDNYQGSLFYFEDDDLEMGLKKMLRQTPDQE